MHITTQGGRAKESGERNKLPTETRVAQLRVGDMGNVEYVHELDQQNAIDVTNEPVCVYVSMCLIVVCCPSHGSLSSNGSFQSAVSCCSPLVCNSFFVEYFGGKRREWILERNSSHPATNLKPNDLLMACLE